MDTDNIDHTANHIMNNTLFSISEVIRVTATVMTTITVK